MKKFVIANWKMAPESLAQAEGILDAVNDFLETLGERRELSLVFCPPFVFLEEAGKFLSGSHFEHQASLGAQDIATEAKGAMTGEVSGPMLAKLGVRYVIIGHSERRWKLGETDETVNRKLKTALASELVPVVCLGEKERSGDWQGFLREQTLKTFDGLTEDQIARCLVAYEPVWAISTTPGAKPDTPDSALESIQLIRETLSSRFKVKGSRFLYGGSVTPANADDFLKEPGIEGVLVGGASVRKDDFVKILSIAAKI